MAKSTKLSAAERKRRAQQSARDKSGSAKRKPKQSSSKGSKANARGSARSKLGSVSKWKSGIHPYTKLILDPCHAQLTQTPLPGREGSSIIRLPFRQVVTLPTPTINLGGNAYTGGFTQTSLIATLVPTAMSTQPGGAYGISIHALGTESSGAWNPTTLSTTPSGQSGTNAANYQYLLDPPGLTTLNGMESMMRPVAACIKLEFYSGTQNTGSFFGYEGVAGNLIYANAPVAVGTAGAAGYFYPTITNSQFAMGGWSSGIVTEGVEAAVNYAAATPQWQQFRSSVDFSNVGNADGIDYDTSQMPVAVVGLGGGTAGTQYLVSGAIVYEWVPSISLGPTAGVSSRPEVRQQSILDKVVGQLSTYGPMLVGVASKLVTGGPSLALSDLFYRLSINQNNSQGTPARPQIKW